MNTANAVLHAFNDILESLGKKRLSSLDLFVDPDKVIATRMEERDGSKNNYSQSSQNSNSNVNQQSNNNVQRLQQTGVMSNLPRNNTQTPPMGYVAPIATNTEDNRTELMRKLEEMRSKNK